MKKRRVDLVLTLVPNPGLAQNPVLEGKGAEVKTQVRISAVIF